MKSFSSPILLILVAIIVYYYALPLYGHVGQLQEKKEGTVELLNSIKNMEAKIVELEKEYNAFSNYERSVLTSLIPRTVEEFDVTHDITVIADTHNLSLDSIGFESGDGQENARGRVVVEDGGDGETAKPYKKWLVTITLSGAYDNLKNFIDDLGRSIRISDVSEIKIGQTASVKGESETTYEISTLIYSLE